MRTIASRHPPQPHPRQDLRGLTGGGSGVLTGGGSGVLAGGGSGVLAGGGSGVLSGPVGGWTAMRREEYRYAVLKSITRRAGSVRVKVRKQAGRPKPRPHDR